MQNLDLNILDIPIRIICPNPGILKLLESNFSAFRQDCSEVLLTYQIRTSNTQHYEISSSLGDRQLAENTYEIIYFLEGMVTLELQKRRSDLLFIHSAALEKDGNGTIIVAPSGSGKSTTTWALLQNGFRYLSDELAPINLQTLLIQPYPHAICLKARPPEPFLLPDSTIETEHTLHVPTADFATSIKPRPTRLKNIIFVQYDPTAAGPRIEAVSHATAAAHIYSNALNLLAHERYGLDAAIQITRECNSYQLISNDLQQTCQLVLDTIS